MLWIALTVLAAGAGALVALPFLRSRAGDAAAATPVEIYRSQLDAVGRDEKSGDLDQDTAAELRTEIERRILEAPSAAPAAAQAGMQFDRITAAIVAAIVVLGSVLLYAATGSPNTQSAARGGGGDALAANSQNLPDVDTMIESLRARLEASPNDAEGWRMLGWSYFETDRFEPAVEAYRRAVALAPGETGYQSALAEALTRTNGGEVSSEALGLFRQAAARDPADERARYYLALTKNQAGDTRGAIADWIAGVRAAAPDSLWAPRMRADAEAAASRIGLNIAGRMPAAPAAAASALAPGAATPAAPEAQQQMIAGMIAGLEQRLAANPRDEQGWVMLMRSRMVLGEPERAQAALQSALRAHSSDPAAQTRLRAAAGELNVPGA